MITQLACMYNGRMKKQIRTWLTLVLAIALVLAMSVSFAGCVSAAGTSAGAATSASAAAHAKSSSASAASYSAKSAQSSSSAVQVDADDDSYAENNLARDEYDPPNIKVKESGEYTDKDSVALYIHLYGHVPSNYVTKTKARKAGWVNTKGNLWDVLPGKSIGGGGFYNDDGMMPDAPGREWFECDIDYEGGFRNAKRLVYSNDGLIYYTDDHYKTFQRLY